MAVACVTALGITAQIKNVDEPFLESSASECDCIVNATLNLSEFPTASDDSGGGWFEAIYKVSYMYYSMIGTLLTVFFGLLISKLSDMFTNNQILKITSLHDVRKEHGFGFRTPGRFSVASFTLATGHKISSFIHHVAHDVSQSTLKVEHKLKEVISHTNLLHLHHHGLHHSDSDDRINILDDVESTQCDEPVLKETAGKKMFFIGYYEDEEHGNRSRRGSKSENLLSDFHARRHFK